MTTDHHYNMDLQTTELNKAKVRKCMTTPRQFLHILQLLNASLSTRAEVRAFQCLHCQSSDDSPSEQAVLTALQAVVNNANYSDYLQVMMQRWPTLSSLLLPNTTTPSANQPSNSPFPQPANHPSTSAFPLPTRIQVSPTTPSSSKRSPGRPLENAVTIRHRQAPKHHSHPTVHRKKTKKGRQVNHHLKRNNIRRQEQRLRLQY